MATVGYVDAFASYGARHVNANWAVSSVAEDGSLVISCWSHRFKKGDSGGLIYRDNLGRLGTSNPLGRNLLVGHLSKALGEKLLLRIVVATATNPEEVDAGQDANTVSPTNLIKKKLGQNPAYALMSPARICRPPKLD